MEADADAAAFVESVNGGNRVVPTALYSDGTTATNPPASQVRAKLAELAVNGKVAFEADAYDDDGGLLVALTPRG